MSLRARILFASCCAVVAATFTVALVASMGSGLWQENGVAVCTADDNQQSARLTPDPAGGAFVVWKDDRGSDTNIYAQRLDAAGQPIWVGNGVLVCAADNTQDYAELCTHQAGGAVVVWRDRRDSSTTGRDIYAQWLAPNGATLWMTDGLSVCTATSDQASPAVTRGQGQSVIIAWSDKRDGADDIYAQRVGALGSTQWTSDGVSVCTATSYQYYPKLATDGAGGAIIAWEDRRSGSHYDIYAQRVNPVGTILWAADGVSLCAASNDQHIGDSVSDGLGGAIVVWEDDRDSGTTGRDIYAQRVDASGAVLWGIDGVTVCNATSGQQNPQLISDGSGGAFITWEDWRSHGEIFAQRVLANGSMAWTDDGISLCSATGDRDSPVIASDWSGGAIVAWEDYRGPESDIYAQRIDADGNAQWETDGIKVCTATDFQEDPRIMPSTAGGAIVIWEDDRNGSDKDVYAQRVDDVEPIYLPLTLKKYQ